MTTRNLNEFYVLDEEQGREVENLFRITASHFGGRVSSDLAVYFTGSPGNVVLDAAGFERVFITSLVNKYIAGKAEPELKIECDDQGDMVFRFLRRSAKGLQP